MLDAIVDRLPPPRAATEAAVAAAAAAASDAAEPALRARIVDSWFVEHRGVVVLVQIAAGALREGARVRVGRGGGAREFLVHEIGVVAPAQLRTRALHAGHVGYVLMGMKDPRDATLGAPVRSADERAPADDDGGDGRAAARDREQKTMLFASLYPSDGTDFDALVRAVEKLALTDAAVSHAVERSTALGLGLRCGFLGVLHMEVFVQRLEDEHGVGVLATTPLVPYTIVRGRRRAAAGEGGGAEAAEEEVITSLADWPDARREARGGGGGGGFRVLEPIVEVTAIAPAACAGALMDEMHARRGTQREVRPVDDGERVLVRYDVPWGEVVTGLHDAVKSLSAGHASLDVREISAREQGGPPSDGPSPDGPPSAATAAARREADLVKVDVLLNGEPTPPLAFVCHRDAAAREGRRLAARLKDAIERQQFEVRIQAAVGAKVVASERIAPFRKDVLDNGKGGVVGQGDFTRKKKLLEKQKRGKARMRAFGKVPLSQEALWAMTAR